MCIDCHTLRSLRCRSLCRCTSYHNFAFLKGTHMSHHYMIVQLDMCFHTSRSGQRLCWYQHIFRCIGRFHCYMKSCRCPEHKHLLVDKPAHKRRSCSYHSRCRHIHLHTTSVVGCMCSHIYRLYTAHLYCTAFHTHHSGSCLCAVRRIMSHTSSRYRYIDSLH